MAQPFIDLPHDSDDEEDEDYVPPKEDPASDSDDSDDEAPESKRVKNNEIRAVDETQEEKRERAEAIYASFRNTDDLHSDPLKEANFKKGSDVLRSSWLTVKIVKRFLFAGNEIVRVVEVPEDSPDAKKWPLWNADQPITPDASISKGTSNDSSSVNTSTLTSATITASSNLTDLPPPKKPPPKKRKPKVLIDSRPLASSSKSQKLTTLAKSSMDWSAHLESQQPGDRANLEANRKEGGGSYLEKVEFLRRVEERRDKIIEEGKKRKR